MLQKSAVDGIFLKLINQHNFPLHFHPEIPQNLVDYFPLFSKKLLDLNSTICKHPILSNTNPFLIFNYSRIIMKFLYQLPSGVYLMLILFFTSSAENFYINAQFYHSSGIYFEPISKIRLFSKNYNFTSYFDILQPENSKYKIVDISHKLYEHCVLMYIANNCNKLHNRHTQIEFMKKTYKLLSRRNIIYIQTSSQYH